MTLTGPAGWARPGWRVEAAGRLADAFADGVWLVELAAPGAPVAASVAERR